MFEAFKQDYNGIDALVGRTQVNVAGFESLFPIIVLDVRRQNEVLETAVMDIQVRFEFGTPVPANITANAVIISDGLYKMASDEKNMSLLSI